MRYVIIEDEQLIASRLRRMISEIKPEYQFVCLLSGVEEACERLPQRDYDLIFMDIELSDGNCFEIFDAVELLCPVIFTTAYDNYRQRVPVSGSVDYLLKPIRREELRDALLKFEELYACPEYFSHK